MFTWFFVTRYRRKVLTGDMIDYLTAVFRAVCEDFEATLAEYNGEDDHVHLLIEYPPKVQVLHLVNSLKEVSSRMLRKNFRVRTHQNHCGVLPTSRLTAAVRRCRSSSSTSRTSDDRSRFANPALKDGACAHR